MRDRPGLPSRGRRGLGPRLGSPWAELSQHLGLGARGLAQKVTATLPTPMRAALAVCLGYIIVTITTWAAGGSFHCLHFIEEETEVQRY